MTSKHLSIMALNAHTCRWRTSDEKPYEFCGKPTVRPGEKPYCEEHSRVAYYGLNDPVNYAKWLQGEYTVGKRR